MESLRHAGLKNDKLFVIEEHAGAIRERAMADMIINHTKGVKNVRRKDKCFPRFLPVRFCHISAAP
jgi:hypothetical protein